LVNNEKVNNFLNSQIIEIKKIKDPIENNNDNQFKKIEMNSNNDNLSNKINISENQIQNSFNSLNDNNVSTNQDVNKSNLDQKRKSFNLKRKSIRIFVDILKGEDIVLFGNDLFSSIEENLNSNLSDSKYFIF
jgi:membrane-associated HD superfamily phosphohydrolase